MDADEKLKKHRKKVMIIVIVTIVGLLILCICSSSIIFLIPKRYVDGQSMEPTICAGTLVVLKYQNSYESGDVISYKKDRENEFIQRIIGVGGDRLKLSGGEVY